ncbi:MAG: hypothetical protein DRP51_08985 [Candidatus Zixiibacteriota bacterium]|nr:MAG: hypothetical protein DRP51_08985 [candidate division Zixibacteria bacterium]
MAGEGDIFPYVRTVQIVLVNPIRMTHGEYSRCSLGIMTVTGIPIKPRIVITTNIISMYVTKFQASNK